MNESPEAGPTLFPSLSSLISRSQSQASKLEREARERRWKEWREKRGEKMRERSRERERKREREPDFFVVVEPFVAAAFPLLSVGKSRREKLREEEKEEELPQALPSLSSMSAPNNGWNVDEDWFSGPREGRERERK